MTTFALVAGMVPVALGSGEGGDFRAPLGITVIGGVITSTLLTLLVIPTVYEVLADSRDWLIAKFTRRAPRPRAAAGAPRARGRASLTAAETTRCTTRSFPRRWRAGASCT